MSHMDSCGKNIPGRRNRGPELGMFWPTACTAKRPYDGVKVTKRGEWKVMGSESYGSKVLQRVCIDRSHRALQVSVRIWGFTQSKITTLGTAASWNLASGQFQ